MNINVVILSNSATKKHYDLTSQTVKSLYESEDKHKFNIVVVETQPIDVVARFNKTTKNNFGLNSNSAVLYPIQDFGYNKFLNIGLNYVKMTWGLSKFTVFSNNDVIYTRGWFDEILRVSKEMPVVHSFSTYDPNWHCHKDFENEKSAIILGYRRSWHFTGWCHVVKREFFDFIPRFDESFVFHYSDDDLCLEMRNRGVIHGLVRNSIVKHLVSQSHSLIENKKRREFLYDNKPLLEKWRKKDG